MHCPNVVDADYTMVVMGVMGIDGQQVRFCEYENDEVGEINNGNGDCLEERIGIECDNNFSVENWGKKGNNSDLVSSNGSVQDEEILVELGLLEIMSEEAKHDSAAELKGSFRVLWAILSR